MVIDSIVFQSLRLHCLLRQKLLFRFRRCVPEVSVHCYDFHFYKRERRFPKEHTDQYLHGMEYVLWEHLRYYNPQNHPDEFLKRNGSAFSGGLKRSGSILSKNE